MVQLPVDIISDKQAGDYRDELVDNGMVSGFKTVLSTIKNDFPAGGTTQLKIPKKYQQQVSPVLNNDDVREYIDLIIREYENLLKGHPTELLKHICDFEAIIGRGQINKKILGPGGTETESLSNRIVDAMGYVIIRDQIFPKYIRNLGIKVCVYCNANYAITDKDGNGYYDLDHWKPKSLYPYLCTSFYNLQVSCPSCNRRKSDSDNYQFFQLWNDQIDKSKEVLKFKLNYANVARYWITHQSQNDYMRLQGAEAQYSKMRDDMEERLHLEKRYMEHKDVMEEIFWKAKVYNQSFMASLHSGINPDFRKDGHGVSGLNLPISRGDVYRFILGTYMLPEQIYQRPLSKMTQDIAKSLGFEI